MSSPTISSLTESSPTISSLTESSPTISSPTISSPTISSLTASSPTISSLTASSQSVSSKTASSQSSSSQSVLQQPALPPPVLSQTVASVSEAKNTYLILKNQVIDKINAILYDYNGKYSYYHIYNPAYTLTTAELIAYSDQIGNAQTYIKYTAQVTQQLMDNLLKTGAFSSGIAPSTHITDMSNCDGNINVLQDAISKVSSKGFIHVSLPYPMVKETPGSTDLSPLASIIDSSLNAIANFIYTNINPLEQECSKNLNNIFYNYNNDLSVTSGLQNIVNYLSDSPSADGSTAYDNGETSANDFANLTFDNLKYNDISGIIIDTFYWFQTNSAKYLSNFDNCYNFISSQKIEVNNLQTDASNCMKIFNALLENGPNYVMSNKESIVSNILYFNNTFIGVNVDALEFLSSVSRNLLGFISSMEKLHTAIKTYFIASISSNDYDASDILNGTTDYENTCNLIKNLMSYLKNCFTAFNSKTTSTTAESFDCTNTNTILSIITKYSTNPYINYNIQSGQNGLFRYSIFATHINASIKIMIDNSKEISVAKLGIYKQDYDARMGILKSQYGSNADLIKKVYEPQIADLSGKLFMWNEKYDSLNTSFHRKIYEMMGDIFYQNDKISKDTTDIVDHHIMDDNNSSFQQSQNNGLNFIHYNLLIYIYYFLLLIVSYILFFNRPEMSFYFKLFIFTIIAIYPIYFLTIIHYLYAKISYYYYLIVGVPNNDNEVNNIISLPTMSTKVYNQTVSQPDPQTTTQ